MNKMMSALLALAISLPAFAEMVNTNEIGGLESLRKEEVSVEPQAEYMKKDQEGSAMGREFVDMPPLIPHSVDRYQVDKNANSCLRCHSMKNADKWGATKIAVSHYKNREGQQLADVAPNRYFCLTCHVPQKDAKPLKENTFEPVESLKKH
ncbi:nitrate reductase cytochrome c-type subunit [Endozoicomonas arenosclerae]|uniref:nitrate reductase cytochrome c-type subunit n=1 Tax=Endozoicomonas arenosclerae TaxID=1633495 RepID=UPI00078550F6|nr:nitrate reductase cytochrome c-type subunit [Endozoicomonas arenosclerae]